PAYSFVDDTDTGMLLASVGLLRFAVGGAGQLSVASGQVYGATNGGQSLGAAAVRWSEVFAVNGTINTSDAREKTEVAPLSAAEIAAARDLAREIGTFQWLASVAEKGADKARRHVGLTVQRAIEIMESHGLDPMRYGFICYDEWEASVDWDAGDRY